MADGAMRGFDPKFKSPVDFILGCTWEIWEGRGVDLIASTYYAADCPVRTPTVVTATAADVVFGTHATLAEFPDRLVLGEDVIIGSKPSGFYSSHRVRSTATHRGAGRFGTATGRPVVMLTIADCVCRENRIVEEWLVRDNAGLAVQLGLDPVELGGRMGRADPAMAAPGADALVARWRDGNGATIEGDRGIATAVIEAWSQIWGRRDLGALKTAYDRAVRLEAPGNTVHYGVHTAERVLGEFLSAIPDGRFEAHHAIVVREPDRPIRVAVRWSYAGRHSGPGRYGAASRADIALLGISHVELRDERIIAEWMLLDDLSVYAQIAAAKG